MLRALLWKEWREQRQVAAAGVGLAALLPVVVLAVAVSAGPGNQVGDAAEMVPFLTAVMVWPLFAALAGANTNAEEVGSGSLGFLLSLPVSRTRVWAIKVLVASIALAIVVVTSFWLARVVSAVAGNLGSAFPFSSDPFDNASLTPTGVRVTALAFVAVSFAAAVFCSTILRRRLLAAVSGMGVAVLLTVMAFRAERLIAANPWQADDGSELFLAAVLGTTTIALLGGACFVFRAGGMLPGADRQRAAMVVTAGMAIVILSGTMVSADLTTRIRPDDLSFEATLPGGAGVLVRTGHNFFKGMRYGIAATGEPVRLLTDRLSAWALLAPGGERLFYATHRGPFGLRRDACDLRVASLDGREDRQVMTGVSCGGRPVISADGTKIAFLPSRAMLWVLSTDTGEWLRRVALQRTAAERALSLAWLDDSRVVVRGPRAIVLIDVASGEVTIRYADPDADSLSVRAASTSRLVVASHRRNDAGSRTVSGPDGGVATIVRTAETAASRGSIVVLELDSGRVSTLPGLCADSSGPVEFSRDGGRLFYTACRDENAPRNELRVHDFGSGRDAVLAELDGRLGGLMPSPAGSRVLVWERRRDPSSARPVFVMDLASGERHTVKPIAWYQFTDWADEGRLVIGGVYPRTRLAFYDVESGDTEVIAGGSRQ